MGKVRIGIDASRYSKDQKTGIEYYSKYIIDGLINNREINFTLWSNKDKPVDLNSYQNVRWEKLVGNKLWSQVKLGARLFKNNDFNAIFIPSHVVPLIARGKIIVTIHDLAFEYFPDIYSRFDLFYQRFTTRWAVKKAFKIIVPSLTTKNDLIAKYHCPENKIEVIYHGIDKLLFNPKEEKLNYTKITQPYILYSGRVEIKKNLLTLINSYNILCQEKSIQHKLVLVGKPGFGFERIKKELENLPPNIKQNIILTGYLPEREYINLLKNAYIFCMPSLYEGFGMPVLEALACGIPVVASDIPVFKELFKDNVVLVKKEDSFQFAAAFSRLIHKPNDRLKLIKNSEDFVKQFDWLKTTQETLNVLLKN